jgi:hypothetical protein
LRSSLADNKDSIGKRGLSETDFWRISVTVMQIDTARTDCPNQPSPMWLTLISTGLNPPTFKMMKSSAG